jgi:hypothetical protein
MPKSGISTAWVSETSRKAGHPGVAVLSTAGPAEGRTHQDLPGPDGPSWIAALPHAPSARLGEGGAAPLSREFGAADHGQVPARLGFVSAFSRRPARGFQGGRRLSVIATLDTGMLVNSRATVSKAMLKVAADMACSCHDECHRCWLFCVLRSPK